MASVLVRLTKMRERRQELSTSAMEPGNQLYEEMGSKRRLVKLHGRVPMQVKGGQ